MGTQKVPTAKPKKTQQKRRVKGKRRHFRGLR
jgi:hypothetical protein